MNNPKITVTSFNRENLYYSVVKKDLHSFDTIMQILNQESKIINKNNNSITYSPTIIYCSRVDDTESISNFLNQKKIASLPYHAKLNPKKRKIAHHKFMSDEISILCATVAYGMGIGFSIYFLFYFIIILFIFYLKDKPGKNFCFCFNLNIKIYFKIDIRTIIHFGVPQCLEVN